MALGVVRRELILIVVILTTAVAVVYSGYQVAKRLSALNAVPNDNVQWSLAQLDVELLSLDLAGKQALAGRRSDLAALASSARQDFARLLTRTALIGILLILALGGALLLLNHQFRISRRRTVELEKSIEKNTSTLKTSLDAIIVSDRSGKVVEFNPAAERMFGYSRNVAVGAQLEELIIPPRHRVRHREDMLRLRTTGEARAVNSGRVEMSALRASGEEFPVEFSLGTTDGPNGTLVISFLRDISVRVSQEQDILRARDEAIEATKAKSHFLAVMSHEMRTPLNGVMAILELLADSKLNGKQREYVQTAATSAEILKQHVDDVLDLTRMQAGKLDLLSEAFNLPELLEEVRALNEPAAARRGNALTLSYSLEASYFIGDRKRLHQVLTNLIGNALKFTKDGSIVLSAALVQNGSAAPMVELSVADTGIGIPLSRQSHVFEEFVTLEGAYERSSAGAGLGLPICKSIVTGMGGTLRVESKPGKGSTFSIQLPLKPALEHQITASIKLQPVLVDANTPRLCVLVVDDNETNSFVAKEVLLSLNCEVDLAGDGAESVALAHSKRFDLVLMDISMPIMNGWDASKAIRSGDGLSRSTPIVALTAHLLPDSRSMLRECGMQEILVKPLRREALRKILQNSNENLWDKPAHSIKQTDVIDYDQLNEIRDLFGAEEFRTRISAFFTEIERGTDELLKIAARGDVSEVRALSHKLAGSAGIFGAVSLRKSLNDIEDSCTDGEFEVGKLRVLETALIVTREAVHG